MGHSGHSLSKSSDYSFSFSLGHSGHRLPKSIWIFPHFLKTSNFLHLSFFFGHSGNRLPSSSVAAVVKRKECKTAGVARDSVAAVAERRESKSAGVARDSVAAVAQGNREKVKILKVWSLESKAGKFKSDLGLCGRCGLGKKRKYEKFEVLKTWREHSNCT